MARKWMHDDHLMGFVRSSFLAQITFFGEAKFPPPFDSKRDEATFGNLKLTISAFTKYIQEPCAVLAFCLYKHLRLCAYFFIHSIPLPVNGQGDLNVDAYTSKLDLEIRVSEKSIVRNGIRMLEFNERATTTTAAAIDTQATISQRAFHAFPIVKICALLFLDPRKRVDHQQQQQQGVSLKTWSCPTKVIRLREHRS